MIREKEFLGEQQLSSVKLAHVELLSDSLGLRQHAIHGIPMLESGYTVDDNARCLIAMLDFGDIYRKDVARLHCVKMLSFLNYMQLPSGWFRNLMGINRSFLDSGGSTDCFGRSLWACGRAVNSWLDTNYRLNAKKMAEKAIPFVGSLEDIRPIALSLLGLVELAKARPEDTLVQDKIGLLGEKLCTQFELNTDSEWHWFEDILTYDNARMPQAMFAAFQATGNKRFLDVAEKSFKFLEKNTFEGEMFVPVGQDTWFPKHGEKALFDQQPIEAASMVQAAEAGFFATSNDDYKKTALLSFNWFFGGNSLGQSLYDKKTGACFDGLTPKNVNLNQGAESTVEFLLARFSIERLRRKKI